MKKIMRYPITVIIILFLFITLSACTFYDASETTSDGWFVCYSNLFRNCFVGPYYWNGDPENMTLTIPDTYNNFPVTELGGYSGRGVPTPFEVLLPDEYNVEFGTNYNPKDYPEDTSDLYPNGYKVVELKFSLIIGKNLSKIKNTLMGYYAVKQTDGSYILYHAVYYVTCAEENKAFYSKDGRLYYKANDELIEDIAYPVNS